MGIIIINSWADLATNVQILSGLEPGRRGWLDRSKIERTLEKKLLALGFSIAIPLKVIHKRPGGLVVGVGNARIAIGDDLASKVFITVDE